MKQLVKKIQQCPKRATLLRQNRRALQTLMSEYVGIHSDWQCLQFLTRSDIAQKALACSIYIPKTHTSRSLHSKRKILFQTVQTTLRSVQWWWVPNWCDKFVRKTSTRRLQSWLSERLKTEVRTGWKIQKCYITGIVCFFEFVSCYSDWIRICMDLMDI